MTMASGTKLGRYEIRSKLGEGGMGEVYLARDTRLDRDVALKILPAQLASDRDRMNRFVQEAKAVSALNHPNILTIYEIEHSDSTHFIATEFIEGATLRQRLQNAPMEIGEVLDVAIQIASALSAAHTAGVVHRDIKPENIMVRRDGVAKLLDFGLAKLNQRSDANPATTEAVTKLLVQTERGFLLGTAGYMSPEQARGLAVDARTDIFNLGIVIYEMVTGHAPFSGATRTDLIVALLERIPAPLAHFRRDVPNELERISMKALAKDREMRYQTPKDLFIDLKRLQQKLLVAAQSEDLNSQGGIAPSTSVPTHVIGNRHKASLAISLTILFVAVGGLAYALFRFAGRKTSVPSSPAVKMTRLTSTSRVFDGSVSPDGKRIVYGVEESGRQSLWLRQVASSASVQIVPPTDATYANFSFTGDGDYLYFNKAEKNGPNSLYRMSSLGGPPRKIIENIGSRAALSSNDKRIAFVRGDPFAGTNSLVIAESDGSQEQVLATRKGPDNFAGGIAWDPHGKSIACVVGNHAQNLIEIPLDGGAEKPVKTPAWFAIVSVEWLPDASGFLAIVLEQIRASPSQLWFFSYPGGEARRITNDFSNYLNVSVTADARTVLVVRRERTSHIWVAPDGDADRAIELTTGTLRQDGEPAVSWTPDGRIVFDSTANGGRHTWIMNADGRDQRQLNEGNYDDQGAHVSPDGRYIVFTSNRTGTFHVFKMDIDGNSVKQLTNGPGEISPFVSPDGRWVICNRNFSSWKVPAEGGELISLTNDSWASDISSDGERVAYVRLAEESSSLWNMMIMPFAGGSPLATFVVRSDSRPSIRWSADGRAILYNLTHGGIVSGVTNVWIQSVDGGPAKQLTNFKSETFSTFGRSVDGRWLAFGRGTTSSDVVLISDFR